MPFVCSKSKGGVFEEGGGTTEGGDGCGRAPVPESLFNPALPCVSGSLLRTDDLVGNLSPASSLTNTQWFCGISALCELRQV